MATTVDIHEAKATLSRLLEQVARGERVVIVRAGKPVADLVPHQRATVLFGTASGRLEYDPDTFDDVDKQLIDAVEGE
jgi:prevent-host-death family protein